MVTDFTDAFSMNESELMEFYHLKGKFGKFRLRMFVLKNWILHSLAYSSPHSDFAIKMQHVRGVHIGKNCHFSPYVLIDLIYPQLVTIGDNVTLGTNCMIFAHMNPSANLLLKTGEYKRKVTSVTIKSGAVLNPGSIITAGITIGENSIIGSGSVVGQDIPDNCVALGNPARVVKKIE